MFAAMESASWRITPSPHVGDYGASGGVASHAHIRPESLRTLTGKFFNLFQAVCLSALSSFGSGRLADVFDARWFVPLSPHLGYRLVAELRLHCRYTAFFAGL